MQLHIRQYMDQFFFHHKKTEYLRSLTIAKRLIEEYPNESNGYCRLVNSLLMLKRTSDAKESCLAALERFPNNQELLKYVDSIYADLMQQNDCSHSFRKLINNIALKLRRDILRNINRFFRYKEGRNIVSILTRNVFEYPKFSASSIRMLQAAESYANKNDINNFSKIMNNIVLSKNLSQRVLKSVLKIAKNAGYIKLIDSVAKIVIQQYYDHKDFYILVLDNMTRVNDQIIVETLIEKLYAHADISLKLSTLDYSIRLGFLKKRIQLSHLLLQHDLSVNQIRYVSAHLLGARRVDKACDYLTMVSIISSQEAQRFNILIKYDFSCISRKLTNEDRYLIRQTQIYKHYNANCFNPEIKYVITSCRRCKLVICFIHVGKCAGTTLINELSKLFVGNKIPIYEFHLFDSDILIRELVEQLKFYHNIHIVISTRDPLDRWISAYNWDLHLYYSQEKYYCPVEAIELFRQYPNAKSLITGLMLQEVGAIELAQKKHFTFGHMSRGVGWYISRELLQKIPSFNLSVISTSRLTKDFEEFVRQISKRYEIGGLTPPVKFERSNVGQSSNYPTNYFSTLHDFSIDERDFLCEHLRNDFNIHDDLIERTNN